MAAEFTPEMMTATLTIWVARAARDDISTQWQTWTPRQRRTFLTLLIDRVVVHEWPPGMPRRRPRLLNESAEDHPSHHEVMLRRAVAARVTIEWLP